MSKGNRNKKRLDPVKLKDAEEMFGGSPINELVLATCGTWTKSARDQKDVLTEGTLTLVADNEIAKQYGPDTLAVLYEYIRQLRIAPGTEDITIDVEEYARAGGYDISVRSQRDAFIRRFEKQRKILYSISASWSIDKGPAQGDYEDVHIIAAKGKRKNHYYIRLDPKLKSAILKQYYLMPMHKRAFVLRAGTKGHPPTKAEQLLPVMTYILTNRYNMTSNRERETHNIIKIETLISNLKLKTVEQMIQQGERKFRREIWQPIEDTLNLMQDEGIIQDWTPCKAKKEPYTDEEKEQIRKVLQEGYITFTLTPIPEEKGEAGHVDEQ